MSDKTKKRRSFSYTEPILYNGEAYPTALVSVNGTERPIFADANGREYVMSEGNIPQEVISQYNLPEVSVFPTPEDMTKDYLTMDRDATYTANGRPQALTIRGLEGAKAHAEWEKEHPNLTSWGYAAGAVPFAVASVPFVGGLGSMTAGTTIGQAAITGASRLLANPIVHGVNQALGIGAGVMGVNDLRQGKFTPMTALDLAGLGYGINSAAGTLSDAESAIRAAYARKAVKAAEEARAVETAPENLVELAQRSRAAANPREGLFDVWETPEHSPFWYRTRDRFTAQYNRAAYENGDPNLPWLSNYNPPLPSQAVYPAVAPAPATVQEGTALNTSSDLLSRLVERTERTRESMALADAREAAREAVRNARNTRSTPNVAATNTEATSAEVPPIDIVREANREARNTVREYNITLNAEAPNPDVGVPAPPPPTVSWQPRNLKAGEQPYTEAEIRDFFYNPDGTLKVNPEDVADYRNSVNTGAHGTDYWYAKHQNPTQTLKNYLAVTEPSTQRKEILDIMRSNPSGRSGVFVGTHNGDTSVDSTPLAYKYATRLGQHFMPFDGGSPTVRSNNYGIVNYFKTGYGNEANRARALFEANPNYEATLLKDADGNMTAFQLKDADGVFQIPLNNQQEVLDIMNKSLHDFNTHYGTQYPDITIYNRWGESPWGFGKSFTLPNIQGMAYKQGGNLKRRLMTSL